MSDDYFEGEMRPRIDGELAEAVIDDEDKSFRENLKEKLGVAEDE